MSEQTKDVVRKYYEEVLNGRDLDGVERYFTDERVIEGVRRGCFAYFEAFPDLHVSIDEFIAEDDRVFCRSTMTGTHEGRFEIGPFRDIPPTGRYVEWKHMHFLRWADGKNTDLWHMWDTHALMRQLGALPQREGAPA